MTIEPSRINAFPWNPNGRACSLFLEPNVWSAALLDCHRRALKKAAKKAGRHGIIQVTDDSKIGEVCCWMMETPTRRKIFAHILERQGYPEICNILFKHFYLDDEKVKSLFPIEIFKIGADKRIYLDPSSFKARIQETKPSASLLRSICILGGAFALLQPDCAHAILEILLEYDSTLENSLLWATESSEITIEDPTTGDQGNGDNRREIVGTGSEVAPSLEMPTVELRQLPISRTWIQLGQRLLNDFLTAETSLRSRTDNLRKLAMDSPLEEVSPLAQIADQCKESANQVNEAAVSVDSWMDEWSESLQQLLASSPEPIRPQIETLLISFRTPRLTTSAMAMASKNANQTLSELAITIASSIASIQGLHTEIKRLRSELRIETATRDDTALPDALVPCLALEQNLQRERDKLVEKMDVIVQTRKTKCTDLLKLINSQTLEPNPEMEEERRYIETRTSTTTSLLELADIESRLRILQEKWPPVLPKQTVEDLAATSLNANLDAGTVLDVVESLAVKRRFQESTMLMTLLQSAYEPDETELDLQRFAALLLHCWSGLAMEAAMVLELENGDKEAETSVTDGLARSTPQMQAWAEFANLNTLKHGWARHALSGQWVGSINAGHLENELLRRRFAGAFIVLHTIGNSADPMNLFYKLALQDHAFGEEYPTLNRMISAIIAQQSFCISDGTLEAGIQEKQRAIRDFFRKQEGGDYIRQVAHGGKVAEVEKCSIFPDLEDLVTRILQQCDSGLFDVAEREAAQIERLAEDAFQKYSLSTTENPYYQRRIFGAKGYLVSLSTSIGELIHEYRRRRNLYPEPNLVCLLSDIQTETIALANKDDGFTDFWHAVRAAFTDHIALQESVEDAIIDLIGECPNAILISPDLLRVHCSATALPALSSTELQDALGQLSRPNPKEALRQLERSGCLKHAHLVAKTISDLPDEEDVVRIEQLFREKEKFLNGRHRTLAQNFEDDKDVEAIGDAILMGKFPLAEELLGLKEREQIAGIEARRQEGTSRLNVLLARVDACEGIALASWDGEIADTLISHCGLVKVKITQLKRRQRESEVTHGVSEEVARMVDALEFAARNRSESFTELETLLDLRTNATFTNLPELSDSVDAFQWGDKELEVAWNALASQRKTIPDSDRLNVGKKWGSLAKAFCRMSGMYHDLRESLNVLKIADYPFGSYTSNFYNPRTAWLDRPVSFFLFIKTPDWKDLWGRLAAHLEICTDTRNVILMPSGYDDLKQLSAFGKPTDDFLVIDVSDAAAVSRAPISGAPLRQLLHRSAQHFTAIGLFCTDGAVHQRKNLFVGREIAIKRLDQEKASALWGGRRIGKTSLLHALKARLEDGKRKDPFRVAYVYADLQGSNPDLLLAERVAESLGLRQPRSVDDLNGIISEACRNQRIAILVDEVDSYIEASRRVHGDAAFPFARTMRGISSQNAEQFKLVYAGFKQLYYEVHIRPNPDNAYPFKNFLKPLRDDFGDFTLEQVEELLSMGFGEMLGIRFDPSVPRLVKERTSGHPAFVQAFGDRLLSRLERRRRAGASLDISRADIDAVYDEDPDGMGEHAAYIDYVYETLGWNLSHLGRAIMLALSNDIIANEHVMDQPYQVGQICDAVERWSNSPRLTPDCPDFINALNFLIMTNMLRRGAGGTVDSYSISYPSYIDFMQKFGDRNRFVVEESLRLYRQDEVGRIA